MLRPGKRKRPWSSLAPLFVCSCCLLSNVDSLTSLSLAKQQQLGIRVPKNSFLESTIRQQLLECNDPVGMQRYLELIVEFSDNLLSQELLLAGMQHFTQASEGYETNRDLQPQPTTIRRFLLPATSSRQKNNDNDSDNNDELNLQVTSIVTGARSLLRVEALARTLGDASLRPDEAENLRNLLVCLSDWQAVLLRCVWSLYSLDHSPTTTPTTTRTAREGLRIYSVLAEQLGKPDLRARIEDRAFATLYRRQYQVAHSLYNTKASLGDLSQHLQDAITQRLGQDRALVSQVESMQITARVKQPFSLWKKLVRKRFGARQHPDMSSVADAVALRVVLQARKLYEDEPLASLRAREKILCYYVREKLRASYAVAVAKDYIRFPKANGYQSLHDTSWIRFQDDRFPFEVQVRSQEMHWIAEHGSASHWGYKLGHASSSSLVLPPAATTAENQHLASLAVTRHEMAQRDIQVFVAVDHGETQVGQLVVLSERCTVQTVRAVVAAIDHLGLKETYDDVHRNGRRVGPDALVQRADVLLFGSKD